MIITKSQAAAEFRECIGQSYRGNHEAKRDAWQAFLDTLLADHLINQTQRDQWQGQ
jgi:hypothetical protein